MSIGQSFFNSNIHNDFIKTNMSACKLHFISQMETAKDSFLTSKSSKSTVERDSWEMQKAAAFRFASSTHSQLDTDILNNIKTDTETLEIISTKIINKSNELSMLTSKVLGIQRVYVKKIESLDETITTYEEMSSLFNEYATIITGL